MNGEYPEAKTPRPLPAGVFSFDLGLIGAAD
jgi:hypothetical protein